MDNIKLLRKRQGLTQQQLADKLHVVRQTVSKWEQGTSAPDGDMLPAVAEALGVPLEELMGLERPVPWYYRLKNPLFIVMLCACVACAVLLGRVIQLKAEYLRFDLYWVSRVFILRGAVGFFGGGAVVCLIPFEKRRPALGCLFIVLAVIVASPAFLYWSGIGWYDIPLLRKIFLYCASHLKFFFAVSGALFFAGVGLLRKK